MISLIRFFEKEEWAEQFLDGTLYMNSIGHFGKLGIEKNDWAEGVGETVSLADFEKQFGTVLSEAFGEHIIHQLFVADSRKQLRDAISGVNSDQIGTKQTLGQPAFG